MQSQYARVLAVLEAATRPLALFEIKDAITAQFRRTDSEAAISARIRDIRRKLESDAAGTVAAWREPGKSWFRYRVRWSESSESSGHFCLM